MIYPLSWLEDYVKTPKSMDELTDRLTMIGHLLDKKIKEDSETFVDLELRGNRPDLLGVFGLAREISAAWNYSLKYPPTKKLPDNDQKNDLFVVKAHDLVERFLAVKLRVKIKQSPEWLKKRLSYYGIPAINNVVDITNYVMLETGEPMHAYDLKKLTGQKLFLRRAYDGERMTTISGSEIHFTKEDLVISDLRQVQGTAIIGSDKSGVTYDTKEIILEAAVYKYANVRHTARRLGIRTEAGTRHEKILDPNQVSWALERAFYLLAELADAEVTGNSQDFYPELITAKSITLSSSAIERLGGVFVPTNTTAGILTRLGCVVAQKNQEMAVKVPTWRTDIDQEADLVEEVLRLYGYEKIPARNLAGELTVGEANPELQLEEKARDTLSSLCLNEIITNSIIPNSDYQFFQKGGDYPKTITISNPPDPDTATLRPSLLPNLVRAVEKAHHYRAANKNFFEVGKIFWQEKEKYLEKSGVAFAIVEPSGGQISLSRLIGYLASFLAELGVAYDIEPLYGYPGLDPKVQGEIVSVKNRTLGYLGLLHPELALALKLPTATFLAELYLPELVAAPKTRAATCQTYPPFPALTEDVTLEIKSGVHLGPAMQKIRHLSPLIKSTQLVSIFENRWTIRLTYQSPTQNVSGSDIQPLRPKILKILKEAGITPIV